MTSEKSGFAFSDGGFIQERSCWANSNLVPQDQALAIQLSLTPVWCCLFLVSDMPMRWWSPLLPSFLYFPPPPPPPPSPPPSYRQCSTSSPSPLSSSFSSSSHVPLPSALLPVNVTKRQDILIFINPKAVRAILPNHQSMQISSFQVLSVSCAASQLEVLPLLTLKQGTVA